MAPFDIIDIFLGLGILTIVIIIILVIIIGLLLSTAFLYIGLKVVDGSNMEFGSVFVTALIIALTSWIPCLGCILAWVIINSRHDTGFGKAIIAWLIAGLIPLLIAAAIVIFVLLPLFVIPAFP